METRASYVLIGAFAFAALVLAFLFVLWLGKLSLDREWGEYDIVFKEAVIGLSLGGAVQYNGIQVGDVRKLKLDPSNPSEVIALIRVAGDTPIKTDTRAKLTFTGLTGVAVIQLTGGSPTSPPLVANEGQARPTIIADESALQKLMSSSEGIVTNVNDLLLRLSVLLDQENVDKVAAALDHIEKVSGSVARKSDDLGEAIANITEASRALKQTLAQTKEVLVSARASLDSAKRFADGAYAVVEQNRDAVASFSNDGLVQVGPTLAELRATLRDLQRLTDRLAENPAAFLLGGDQPKEYER
jgi:phospholipid/cholesterol/gamma-HCH transport system substrate-binding protein